MKKFVATALVAALALPSAPAVADEHPRSYYPTLTRADISVCRAQFAALQADVVEHFRQSAASYAPGGEAYKTNPAGYADGNNVRVYTQAKNEFAAKDPLTFYVEGLMGEGERVGDLDSINKYWDEEIANVWLTRVAEIKPANWLRYSLARPQIETPAEKCVAKVWLKKFNAMHASPTPSANPAVWSLSESLTPLSIGSSNAPVPPGKDAHIIASDGKSAMTCVKLIRIASGDSKLLGTGARVLSNQCSDAVEAGWCYSPGDCETETGSGWTIRPGHSWPLQSAGEVRWAACHGANTQSFVKGSHGLRYYCKAPK